jgi:hypothetical protein
LKINGSSRQRPDKLKKTAAAGNSLKKFNSSCRQRPDKWKTEERNAFRD